MSAFLPPTSAPAGWYPDPEGGAVSRYFDGREWASPVDHDGFGPHRPPHPELPVSTAVGALAILVVSLLGGRLLVDQLITFGWPVLVYVAILTGVGYGPSLWWCWYVTRRWGTGSLSRDIGLRFRWTDLGWGPLIWVSAVLCQIVVAAVVITTGVPTTSNTEGIAELDADRSYVIALLVTAVIAAPLVEEMVFRGVVLRGLLGRLGVVLTIGLQAVLFGLAHADPVRGTGNIGLVLILSGVGAALGVAAFLLRRIGPTIVAHALFNGVVLAIVLTGLADRLQERLDESAAVAGVEQVHVVDEAHTTDPHRHHQPGVLVEVLGRSERALVDHRGVLDLGPGFDPQPLQHRSFHLGHVGEIAGSSLEQTTSCAERVGDAPGHAA
ncbi:hypothetical protein BH23ACT3_BH23ACT3_13800 [soil metagenome]